VAEGGGLLNRYRCKTPIVGSNPIPSANLNHSAPHYPNPAIRSMSLSFRTVRVPDRANPAKEVAHWQPPTPISYQPLRPAQSAAKPFDVLIVQSPGGLRRIRFGSLSALGMNTDTTYGEISRWPDLKRWHYRATA
jgi:hypothetical protein